MNLHMATRCRSRPVVSVPGPARDCLGSLFLSGSKVDSFVGGFGCLIIKI